MDDPDPRVIEIAVEARAPVDRQALADAIAALSDSDPSVEAWTDPESGQSILAGASEAALDQAVDRLRAAVKGRIDVGAPQVAYRETITRPWTVIYSHMKQFGGRGEFAKVLLAFSPGAPGSGYVFVNAVTNGAVPAACIPGVERGVSTSRRNGLIAGFPLIDFEARLIGGAYHDIDSTPLAFEIAARAAFRELRKHANPVLLEPIMKVEVLTPKEYLADVIGDLNSRRAQIAATDHRDDRHTVTALVKLSNMFGYAGNLRGMTRATASFNMRFDHYARVPPSDDDPDLFPPAAAMRA
jgi:elongation factor G